MVRALVLLGQMRGGENDLVACGFRQARGRRDGRTELTLIRATQGNMSKVSSQRGSWLAWSIGTQSSLLNGCMMPSTCGCFAGP